MNIALTVKLPVGQASENRKLNLFMGRVPVLGSQKSSAPLKVKKSIKTVGFTIFAGSIF